MTRSSRATNTPRTTTSQFTPEEIKSFEEAAASTASLDAFVPEDAIDPVYFEDTYYLGAGKNGGAWVSAARGGAPSAHRIAVGTFTWRGQTTPIAIRVRQDGLLLQWLYFADEVQALSEIDMGAAPKLRDQELTLAERLISEVSGTELHPERYEDEYRKRLVKAIEQKAAGQEVARVEIAARPATTDLVAALKGSLERKPLAKAAPAAVKAEANPAAPKRPARQRQPS